MRNRVNAVIASASVVVAACAQPSTDQGELARVHWLSGIKSIVQSGDFSDYQRVAKALNLTLIAQPPVEVKDVDGKISGESFDVKIIPTKGVSDKGKIDFYYRVYTPNDRSYRRAIVTARKVGLSECIALSDIYETFGRGRKMAYPDSGYYAANYHFNGSNIIDLSFTFDAVDAKCLSQIAIFQNRWK
ncbi:hypothetical protein [Burkholderia vietnamiensis]|uniref:Lipoprotein n=1 Tax=Burkholderia vietnamiensis TaxID=60552 RepID=A0ABS1AQF7_BURVI|nr:hypothetical protein [Burkholderia vietnamiensis]MBH9646482.1 hypothetical protein [Burkholderia vietnamiensis]MBJ9685706.1 hypothetical protein [Burkholderia vietnamiensis]MBR8009737.1 hypothetical protein [Burkholderia vietnamiensis]HDR8987876.1 hypothetical protein [Burkholderia vietnamiensis]HDR9059570.1 hypothetical protein [Burkholderia vietnamiensis]